MPMGTALVRGTPGRLIDVPWPSLVISRNVVRSIDRVHLPRAVPEPPTEDGREPLLLWISEIGSFRGRETREG